MAISVFDLFSIGIGPSSSHTVGPMRAARMFARRLKSEGLLAQTAAVRAELFGSLGATGHGHGTPKAVLLGLEGNSPRTVDVDQAELDVERIKATKQLRLLGHDLADAHQIAFDTDTQLILHRRRSLPYHANGMTLAAYDADGVPVLEKTYYSVGGGFVVDEDAIGADRVKPDDTVLRYPFRTGEELLRLTRETGLSISGLMLENEKAWRSEAEIRTGLLEIWRVMQECVAAGDVPRGHPAGRPEGPPPGRQRRPALRAEGIGPTNAMEWVTLYAMAVNEENASGQRVVTAPTNGAAGIIPAVLHYFLNFIPGADEDGIVRFLLAAGAIGMLFKENASISGAEVGCQGEVGSACSMAAAWPRRGTGRLPRAGRERRRDRHRAQPRPHLRPGRRPGPDPVHRAQRHGLGQGDHGGPDGAAGRRPPPRLPRQGDQDHEGDRRRHEGQVQGDLARRTRGQRHRVLTGCGSGRP